ncbi:MAG: ribonuclease R [Pirellulaceae bacterium]
MEIEEFEKSVLDHVNHPNYQPVKPKVIAKKLGVLEEDRKTFKRALKRLIRGGQIQYGDSHLVTKADSNAAKPAKSAGKSSGKSSHKSGKGDKQDNTMVGRYQRNARGFGFVRPQGTPASAERTQDIFVPPRRGKDATTGDLVKVKVYSGRGPGRDMRLCGDVIEILERETHQFVGTYAENHGAAVVQVDGNVFAQPVSVGDPGVKGARPNDKVVIEMVRFPSHVHEGEAVIVEVLGQRGEPGVDLLSVMREYDLPQEFPDKALQVARDQADKFTEEVGPDRRDLTQTTILTIDPDDARDFDDAISLERLDNGHWLLGVHIADVSYFVPEGSALDVEARSRATSIYLPDKVIPMLPETISNNLASLQPNKVRYSRTAFIEFTEDGSRVATEVCKAAIRSKRRFTYEEVDDFLEDPTPWKSKLEPDVHRLLGEMHTFAMILRKRRIKRGSIELTMPEIKLDLNADGEVIGAHKVVNTESHQIVEEYMLAANEAVAEALADQELIFLRRVHGSPDPRKLEALTSFVQEVGIECEDMKSRFEIIRVLSEVKGQPEQAAVNFATLRSMQKAVYSPEEIGHYALASECYCHFTSPIRRYPDLTIHRMFDQLENKVRPAQDLGDMQLEGDHCSEREQRAAKAERDLTKLKLLNYMSTRIGEESDAVITGVEAFGLFVQGLEIPAEGLIHIDSLQDDYYRFDGTARALVGGREDNAFRLGDVLRVAIARVDLDRRELDYRVVGRTKSRPPRPPRDSNQGNRGRRPSAAKSRDTKGKKDGGRRRG